MKIRFSRSHVLIVSVGALSGHLFSLPVRVSGNTRNIIASPKTPEMLNKLAISRMTRNSNTKICTPFANPERQFRARKDTTPISVLNIYSFYESEQSNIESEEMGEDDIETLTMEQYLGLDRGDTRRGVWKPENEGNMDFEIKGQFLRELRDNVS
ncbi:hypothetical protein Tco_1008860 [Tanacetum coccineum]